jgi:hypothetical protein
MFKTLSHLFTPQKSNNHRPKILHPAGLTILVALFLFAQSTIEIFKAVPINTGFVLGFASSITADQVIDQTNSQRAQLGLAPLQTSHALTQAAIAKANDMFLSNYWAHISPAGTTPWVFIRNAGYQYSVAGENLARDFDTTNPMINAWMASSTHRDNIVNPRYQDIGVAVVNGTLNGLETTIVVQMFGSPVSSTVLSEINPRAIASQPQPQSAEPLTPTQPLEPETTPETLTPLPPSTPTNLSSATGQESPLNLISPLMLTKVFATGIVLLLVGVLAYDALITHQRKTVRLVGRNLAHLSFLGILLLVILAMTPGKIY